MREIITNTEEGFIDLTFDIIECNKFTVSSSRVEYNVWAKGLYKGNVVGLGLLLSATKKIFRPFTLGVGINSLGEESDNLLKALAELYGETIPEQSKMKAYVPAGFFVLSDLKNKKDCFDNMKVDIKMFFGEDDGNQCEHYLNIDLPNKIVEFHEKDEVYRKSIIECFTL